MQTYAWGINPRAQLSAAFHSGKEGPISCTVFDEPKLIGGSYKGFTVALNKDNTLAILGGGVNGEMGNGGHKASYYLPVKPTLSIPVSAFDCGGAHILALLSGGRCATWGGNSFGTLGNGTSGEGLEATGTGTPFIIPSLSDIIQVSTSNGIAAALHADGQVATWGEGSALGIGRLLPKGSPLGLKPSWLPGLSNVKAIATGGFANKNHILALLSDGTVLQWGYKVGCGTTEDVLSPTPVEGLTNIVGIAAGPAQSFAWDAAGNLFAWGGNNLGQLFLPATVPSVSAHSPALVATNVAMVSCGFMFSIMLRKDGTVEGAGRNDNAQLPPAGALQHIDWIGCGEQHSFAQGHGDPIKPPITTKPLGGGKVEVTWLSPPVTKLWEVSSHVLSTVQGKVTKYPPDERRAVITTEPGKQTEIKVRNGTTFARYAICVAT